MFLHRFCNARKYRDKRQLTFVIIIVVVVIIVPENQFCCEAEAWLENNGGMKYVFFFYKMGHIGAVASFREEIMNPQFFVCAVTFKI